MYKRCVFYNVVNWKYERAYPRLGPAGYGAQRPCKTALRAISGDLGMFVGRDGNYQHLLSKSVLLNRFRSISGDFSTLVLIR